jgi:hypothetical protein
MGSMTTSTTDWRAIRAYYTAMVAATGMMARPPLAESRDVDPAMGDVTDPTLGRLHGLYEMDTGLVRIASWAARRVLDVVQSPSVLATSVTHKHAQLLLVHEIVHGFGRPKYRVEPQWLEEVITEMAARVVVGWTDGQAGYDDDIELLISSFFQAHDRDVVYSAISAAAIAEKTTTEGSLTVSGFVARVRAMLDAHDQPRPDLTQYPIRSAL